MIKAKKRKEEKKENGNERKREKRKEKSNPREKEKGKEGPGEPGG